MWYGLNNSFSSLNPYMNMGMNNNNSFGMGMNNQCMHISNETLLLEHYKSYINFLEGQILSILGKLMQLFYNGDFIYDLKEMITKVND